MEKFILIQRDNAEQVLEVKGIYTYKEAFEILENGNKELGGKLYVPEGCHDWAFEWHYNDYNGTYWSMFPIDNKFKYPDSLE